MYCDISESCGKVLSLVISKNYIHDAPITGDVRDIRSQHGKNVSPPDVILLDFCVRI